MNDHSGRIGHWFFRQPYLLLFLTALFWGGNAVAGKAAVGEVSPMLMTSLRWLVAAVVALYLARDHLIREWSTIRARLLSLFMMGALGFAIFNILLYSALHFTSAINVTIEQSAMPMLIVLINFLFFRERIGLLFALGIALSLLGVAVTATHGDIFAIVTLTVNRGDALMMLAVLFYSGYSVSLRNRPQLHWLSFFAVLSVSAFIATIPFALFENAVGDAVWPSPKGVAVIFYIGLFPSLFAQIFYARGIELIGANRAGVFINLVPVLGSALAILLLGEQPALYHGVGYGLILAGIIVSQRRV